MEFGTDPLKLSGTAVGASEPFEDGGAERRTQFVHRVQIARLKPNTTYCEMEVIELLSLML